MAWLAKLLLGSLGGVFKPLFGFLNGFVDAQTQRHIADNTMLSTLGTATLAAESKADESNTAVRLKEGPHSPWVLCTIFLFMLPTGFHYTQVILDSCAWVPSLDDWYLPTLAQHAVGSWNVAKLPGAFDTTEHAIINSLFVGATAMFTGLGLIKGLRQ